MKTLQQIKETYAGTLGYKSWLFLMLNESAFKIQKYNDDVAKLYAKEVSLQSLKNANDNVLKNKNKDWYDQNKKSIKQCILNDKNIPTLK